MATGLLIMGVGRATRFLRFLGGLAKTYEATMRLGIETTTLDAEGEITSTAEVRVPDEQLSRAVAALVGTSLQTPPAFSAVKVGGRRLYEAARQGETLQAGARPIHVERFEVVARRGDDVDLAVTCGGGTYVRVLAADVGRALGCGAHLTALRRTRIGSFDVAHASPPESPSQPLPIARAVSHLPTVTLEPEEATAAGHGRVLGPTTLHGPYAVVGPDHELIGVYEDDGPRSKPLVVLQRTEG
jgi:tRNA pseudouridine55 synthase